MKVDENLRKEIKAYDDGQHVVLTPIQPEEPKKNDPIEIVIPDVVSIGDDIQELED